jgi:hypothetical protein
MITITFLERIEHLLPSHDAESVLRRRVVRLLADAGGQLSVDALRSALGSEGRAAVVSDALQWWDGLRWSVARGVTYVSLAPWVRERLELPAEEEEPRPGPVDSGSTDPLAGVRAAVARARNIYTVPEALEHAGLARYRVAS